ncbi:ROK family transcriptional regulator [Flindersiella endophytica]
MTRLAGSSRLLRAMNESAAFSYLLEHGTLTRGDLRELTGLSKPTASEVLRRLHELGLVVVAGRSSGGPGPNAEIYAVNPVVGFTIALSVREVRDATGPALVGSLADITGSVRATLETYIDFGSTDPVELVHTAVADLCRRARVARKRVLHVQLGVPGSYDERTDTIRYVDVPGWSRAGLVGEIRKRLRCKVEVDNDVNLAAVAERSSGVAAGRGAFTLLWLGAEGLGLAIDLGDRLLRGSRGGAGEIGYMPVGRRGLGGQSEQDFQDLVGGPAVLEQAREFGITAATPQAAVAAAATNSSERDLAFLRALAERIAVGLSAVVAVLDPPLIVLGGEIGQAGGPALRDAVTDALRRMSPLEGPLEGEVAATTVRGDAVLLGALGSGLAAVREGLLATLAEPTAASAPAARLG